MADHLRAQAAAIAGRAHAGVRGVAAGVRAARGWRARISLFAAGALSTLAFAPVFAWPVLALTFPVLLWQLDGAQDGPKPMRASALAAWWFAFGYFFTGLIWIGEAFLVEAEIFAWLLPFAVTLLPASIALFWALAGGVLGAVWPKPGARAPAANAIAKLAMLAIALSIAEWLRGHTFTGLPWNTPGLALTYPIQLMQAASIFGIYGLTAWALLLLPWPLVILSAPGRPHGSLAVAVPAAVLSAAFGLGDLRLAAPPTPPLAGVNVRIVQPSIPQRDKWIGAKQREIFALHLDLSRRNERGEIDDLAGVSHLIWPEAAMPFLPLEHPEALAAIGSLLPAGTRLLTGALRADREGPGAPQFYNSLMVFGADGVLEGLYDKVHLVPFGEYLPFQAALEAIGLQSLTRQRGGFSRGRQPKALLNVAGLPKVSAMICYEAIFPGEVTEDGTRPGLIVIVTNDGWFGNSTGPPQHFHQARVRAVEQGVSVVRAANNGISAVIDPKGRILSLLPLDARGSITHAIPAALRPPVYAVWGEYALFFVILALVALLLLCNTFKTGPYPPHITAG